VDGRLSSRRRPSVALVPWGTPIEVFLDPLHLGLTDFCDRLTGGWLFGYAEGLAATGYEPTIVVSSRSSAATQRRTHLPTGTQVVVLPAPASARARRPGLRRDLDAYRCALAPGLLAELSGHDAVLVQEYEEPRADLLAWWGRRRGLPVLASFQGGIPPWEAAPLQRVARGPSMRRLAGLLVGPAEEAERVVTDRRVDADRVHRVMNPVETARWRPEDRAPARARLAVPDDALVVAWHGRVDLRRKGLDVLVAAWAQVCAGEPDADLRLLLVGSGADDAELGALLAGPGLRGVTWLARYAEPEQVGARLAACDVWVSASRHEGFAVAPLEAMACGRPVVLADAPGARELAGGGDEDGGVLVPRGDAGALADALLGLLAAPQRRAQLGRAARHRVEHHFSTLAVGEQLRLALTRAGVTPG
jgi:glycosyltransferase involved in cell wall biosynthesis